LDIAARAAVQSIATGPAVRGRWRPPSPSISPASRKNGSRRGRYRSPAMARDWETWLRNSSGPASDDEEAKRDRTEKRVKDAIRASTELPSSVEVYVKGSYANNTNVRLDADVDIDVKWTDQFDVDRMGSAVGASPAALGYTPATTQFSPPAFRRKIERALIDAFGASAVDTTRNKCIEVAAGSTTLDADVVPCKMLRRWDRLGTRYNEGVNLYPTDGSGPITNWPDQNYANGVAKNNATGRRYKAIIGCLKRLENEMLDDGVIRLPVPGYLIECLLWNAPNSCFGYTRFLDDVEAVLRFLWTPLQTDTAVREWGEINELTYLFRPGQRWTRQQAFNFIDKAWDTIFS
jgi:hypothetical protein